MTKDNPLKVIQVLAGEQGVPPESHPRSNPIPKQILPGWVRWPIRCLVFPFMFFDIGIQRVIEKLFPRPFTLKGGCKMRGHCCYYILLLWPRYLKWLPFIGWAYTWWLTEVNGFFFRGFTIEDDQGDQFRVMSCRYLQPNGKCGHHILRPTICRQHPRRGFYKKPRILKGCGYQVTPNPKFFSSSPSQIDEEKNSAPSQNN